MNKDLENKELQIDENEVLEEDLVKLPHEIRAELDKKYCELINLKITEQGKRPLIDFLVPKFDIREQEKIGAKVCYAIREAVVENNQLILKAFIAKKELKFVQDWAPKKLDILIDHLCSDRLVNGEQVQARMNGTISSAGTYGGVCLIKTEGFRSILSSMIAESKQLKPDNRKASVKAAKKLTNYSEDEQTIAANGFRENIKSINFSVVCGDISKVEERQYDEERINGLAIDANRKNKLFGDELDSAVNASTLSKQKTFLDDYSPVGIDLDLDQDGPDTVSIGKNVTLTGKRVEDHIQKTLYGVVTELYNTAEIKFKTAIGNAPDCVISMVKDAIEDAKSRENTYKSANSNRRNSYNPTATVISCNQLALMIIKELFKGDLNFLAMTHASGQGDDPEAGGLLPNRPVKTPEPKHDLDLDFDDVDAYGDIVQ